MNKPGQYFKAKLDEFPLSLLEITDTVAQSIVKHEFLSSDGALVENYGLKAKEIRFTALFFGGILNGPAMYANHFPFLEKITDTSLEHVLTHPKYGEIRGFIQDISVKHDDTIEYVEIAITFIENRLNQDSFLTLSAMQRINQLQVQAMNSALAKAGAGVNAISGLTGKIINFSSSLRNQITGVTSKVSTFLTTCDGFIGAVDTLVDTVTSPAIAINNAITFTNDIPGKLCSTVFNATNRVASSLVSLRKSPVLFVNGLINGVKGIGTIIDSFHRYGDTVALLHKLNNTISAGACAVQAMNLLQADENNRATAQSQETRRSFDAKGIRINSIEPPETMSVQAIELLLYNIRAYIQECIDYDRDNRELKDMAWALVQYVDEIKLNKRNQVTMTVSSIPLHLLCLQLGLPYNAADRILKINPSIKNPTFTEGQIQVYSE